MTSTSEPRSADQVCAGRLEGPHLADVRERHPQGHGHRSLAGAQEVRANGARHDARHVPRRSAVHGRHRHGGGRAHLPGLQPAPGAGPVPAGGSDARCRPCRRRHSIRPSSWAAPRTWERSRRASSRISCCSTPIRSRTSPTPKRSVASCLRAAISTAAALDRMLTGVEKAAAAEPVPAAKHGGAP